jgi:molecular chaperone GrpE
MSVNDGLPDIEIVEAEMVPEEEPVTAEMLGLDLPDEPTEALAVVLSALAETRAEADRYVDDLRRVAADFDNYRKRTLRGQAALIERASERIMVALLPVLDSLDSAAAIEPRSVTEEKMAAGVRGTLLQLLDILSREGLEVIPTWDEPFDPRIHEAVLRTGEGDAPLIVTKELRRGYQLAGRVLRPALVEVAPRSDEAEVEQDSP